MSSPGISSSTDRSPWASGISASNSPTRSPMTTTPSRPTMPATPHESPASKTVGKVNPSYEYATDQYVYALWSQGFRRGGANSVPLVGTVPGESAAGDLSAGQDQQLRGGPQGALQQRSQSIRSHVSTSSGTTRRSPPACLPATLRSTTPTPPSRKASSSRPADRCSCARLTYSRGLRLRGRAVDQRLLVAREQGPVVIHARGPYG